MAGITIKRPNEDYQRMITQGKKHLRAGGSEWSKWTQYLMGDAASSLGIPIPQELQDGQDLFNIAFNGPWIASKTLLAHLVHKYPEPIVISRRPEKQANAEIMEAVQTHFLEDGNHRFRHQLRMCFIEAHFKNISYLKQGWSKKKADSAAASSELLKHRDYEQTGVLDSTLKSVLTGTDIMTLISDLSTPGSRAFEGWWCQRVPANHILGPDGYEFMSEWPWMVHVIFKDRYEAMEDYDALEGIDPVMLAPMDMGLYDDPTYNPQHANKYVIYEFYDRRHYNEKKILHFTNIKDKQQDGKVSLFQLKESDWKIPTGDDFPISMLRLSHVPGKFYSPPDVKFYEPFSKALSEAMENYLAGTRNNKTIFGGSPSLTPKHVDLVKKADDRDVVLLPGQESLWVIKTNAPYLDHGYLNFLRMMFAEFSGTSEGMRAGGMPVDSATEAQLSQQGAQNRIDDIESDVEDFVQDILSKQGRVLQELAPTKLVTRIVPHLIEKHGSAWKEFDKQDIQGDFIYRMRVGSMRNKKSSKSAQEAYDAFNVGINHPFVKQKELLRMFLTDYVGMDDPSVIMKDEEDPDLQRAIDLENHMAMTLQPIPPPQPGENTTAHLAGHQKALKEPPPELAARIAEARNSILPAIQNGETVPLDAQQAAQQALQTWQAASQILEKHIQETQELESKGVNPLNFNRASAKEGEIRGQQNTPSTTVNLGV